MKPIIPKQNANGGPNQNQDFDYAAPIPAMLLQVWSTIAQTILTSSRNCLTQQQVIGLVTTPQILVRYAKDKKAYQAYQKLDKVKRSQVVRLTFAQKLYCLS